MIYKLNEILKGIDKDQCDSSDGWWETSSGAEFGAKKLKEVQDLVKKLTLTDVSQQRELLKFFVETQASELFKTETGFKYNKDCIEETIKNFNCL